MKKICSCILSTMLMLPVVLAARDNAVTVEWEHVNDPLVSAYIMLDGGDAMMVKVKGDIEGRKYHIEEVVVEAGVEKERMKYPTMEMWCDSIQFTAVTKVVAADSVKTIAFGGLRQSPTPLKNCRNCILMETVSDSYNVDAPLPLLAFAPGIDLGGGMLYFCGVRDAKLHPALWSKELKLSDYIYWELVVEE